MALANTLGFIVRHPLNRNRKLRGLWQFARWQIRIRFGGDRSCTLDFGFEIFRCARRNGSDRKLLLRPSRGRDMGFVLHFLRSDDLFVDVGANSGSYTILAAAVVGADRVAFEPGSDAFVRLEANIALNIADDRVQAINAGVANESGMLQFTADEDTMNRVLTANDDHSEGISIPVVTLDEALDGRSPRLIKIDVEGFEEDVVRGAQRTLADPELKALILELNGSGSSIPPQRRSPAR